jgi:hypothetical protein
LQASATTPGKSTTATAPITFLAPDPGKYERRLPPRPRIASGPWTPLATDLVRRLLQRHGVVFDTGATAGRARNLCAEVVLPVRVA